jgi:hypothetical protein
MNKKVIFIGGTAYSGSTFFDMTLANDERGFSCGEVYAIFYPYRKHHYDLDSLGESSTIDWRQIKTDGAENLYANIFNRLPDINFIVDSSKHPIWIADRTAGLEKSGIEVKNILIWKTPAELYQSRKKRGRGKKWEREWLGYHSYYMRLIKNWRAIKYSDLTSRRDSLEKLCRELGIDYFPNKEKFWQKSHNTLFGNWSAKIHLDESENVSAHNATSNDAHRKIYYTAASEQPVIKRQEEVDSIHEILEFASIHNEEFDANVLETKASSVRPPRNYEWIQQLKFRLSILRRW